LQAWKLIDPHAGEAFAALREAGVKTAVVSNFDTRLRPILEQLGCSDWFDALAVSAEVRPCSCFSAESAICF
jgi:FMN phosphatase YigB (HAD superfamily)